MTRWEWVVKVLSESAGEKLPREYKLWLHDNVTLKNIKVCIEDCVCGELDWINKFKHKGIVFVQLGNSTCKKEEVDTSKQALILVPYFYNISNPYYLVFWYIPGNNVVKKESPKEQNIKIKRFALPTFEEWQKRNYEIRLNLGVYRLEIRCVAWGPEYRRYKFALALCNENACNIYTERLFADNFVYAHDGIDKLKKWYNETAEAFHDFWENHIKSTYFQN